MTKPRGKEARRERTRDRIDCLVTQLKGQISSERLASLEKDGLVRQTMIEGQGQEVVKVL